MRSIAALFVIVIFFLITGRSVEALTLTPSYLDFSLERGEKIEKKITIQNDSQSQAIYKLEIADVKFTQDQTPQFLTSQDIPPDSIRWWTNLDLGELMMNPGETKDVTLSFTVADDATPGGHYAALMVSSSASETGEDKASIGVNQKLASLLLINVEGQVNRFIEIENFSPNSSINGSLPIKFSMIVKNNGNTHLQPHGVIHIFDQFSNKLVGQVVVNEDFNYLFPQSQKFFEVEWEDPNPLGSFWRYFGRYKAILEMKAENTPSVKSETWFWIIPGRVILFAIVFIAVVLLFLIIYAKIVIRSRSTRKSSRHKGGYG